ncbi:MAG: ABC transporter permease, partial [Bacteroidota bacterium]
MKPQPPKRALRFLHWFCRDDFLEEIEGDLTELFDRTVQNQSLSSAKRRFWMQTLLHFRPDFIRAFSLFPSFIDLAMLRNYLIVAIRGMLKQKLFSCINIGGLALGIACFVLIFRFVQQELSYDSFFAQEQIYRVYQHQAGNMYLGSDFFAVTPAGLAHVMQETFPEVEAATSFRSRRSLLGVDENSFQENGLLADENFFRVLPFELIEGNPQEVLAQPNTIVLSQELARKFFPRSSAIGKSVQYQNGETYTVTGIAKTPPQNSSLQFNFIASILSNPDYQRTVNSTAWQNNSDQTFFTLNPGADPKALEAKFPALLEKHSGNDESYPFKDTYYVQSFNELHFEKGINMDIGMKGDIQFVRIISIIALLILLLACINYMNLAIARSVRRAKEVGLRKVVGAG